MSKNKLITKGKNKKKKNTDRYKDKKLFYLFI